MANSIIKLTYLDLDGRGEIIRLVLTFAGKAFKDIRISKEDWPKFKLTAPLGQVPFVEIDGVVFSQSLAIAQYFAREFNLYGKTNLDGLEIDQISQITADFIQEFAKTFYEQDAVKKAEISAQVAEKEVPRYIDHFEKLLQKNGGEYFVGDSYTLADFIAYDVGTGFFKSYTQVALEKAPLLKALIEKIGNIEVIRAFKERHK
uniref:Glutathione transferase n=1 Tax=Arion vulgaris TaxID=1028688 RepID=A0A0B7A527_9EUPU